MQSKTASISYVKGIDVSHHNGTVDWYKVKNSGIRFAYVKATEGDSFVSPALSTLVNGARSAGLPVGVYHFARPTDNSPINEALHFYYAIKSILPDMGDLAPVLDLEAPTEEGATTGDFLVDWTKEFINEFTYLSGRQVMVYTGSWFVDQFNITGLEKFPLWIANYATSQPSNCGGWARWVAFQYTETGSVDGIDGSVDINVATSIDELYGWKVCNTMVRYTTSDLNVRTGYSTDFPVKQIIPVEAKVTITKLNPSWAYASEYGGWVSRKYLRQ